MDVIEAIRTRRSIGTVREDTPPIEAIHAILEAGTWAPNHYGVEPWRFFVLTGDARARLGDVDAAITADTLPDHIDAAVKADLLAKQKAKSFRAPYIIIVVVDKPSAEKVIYIENIAAVGAAVQNMLLAAHSLGLGAKWRTGKVAYSARTKAFLGLDDDADILGFVYVGYPDEEPEPGERQPFDRKTTWLT
ncbi:nitroreductase [Candidatus Poribacteria bacterium]|nr:nitroreductase [Candidatus Poribacteria bacterium]